MSKKSINIEGESLQAILAWPVEDWDDLILIDEAISFTIGSAEVLGQFAVNGNRLMVELGHIDGGGEGVLPAISKLAKHVAKLKQLNEIDCIVHAVSCANPNPKLRAHLFKTGFDIRDIEGKGEVFFKNINC